MGIAWKLTPLLVAGLAVAACSRGGDGDTADHVAIERLMRELANDLTSGDADSLAALFSRDCTSAADSASTAILLLGDADMAIEITSVDVRNVEGETAEALPKGTITIDGESAALEDGSDYTSVIKEDGLWKIGDCGYLSTE